MNRLDTAACGGRDPDMFDPDPTDHRTIRSARQVCARCPIRLDCLALALATPDAHGIWGGLTQPERAARRRQQLRNDVNAA